jgi:hypothetical protein
MSWAIHYRVEGAPERWSEEQLKTIRQHQSRWSQRLSRLSSGYAWTGDGAKSGFTQPGPGAAGTRDFKTLILALREFETLFPGVEVIASDDYYLEPTPVAEVDLEDLVGQIAGEGSRSERQAAEPSDPGADDALATPAEDARHGALVDEVEVTLEKARKDFEIWKRAQQGK